MRYENKSIRELATIDGLVGGPFGSSLVSDDYVASGVPVIRGANLAERFVQGDFVFVSQEKFERELARNSAKPGDLVFTQRGTLGQVAIVSGDAYDTYVVSQSQMRLRVDDTVADARFIYYACSAPEFIKQVADNAIATGVPHINLGILGRLVVPQPDLVEQQGIADVLGALDDKIAANTRLAACSLELGDALHHRHMDPTTPSRTLGELADDGSLLLGDGYRTQRSEHGQPGLRILRAGDVRDGQIVPLGEDFVHKAFLPQIGKRASQPGDVVLTTKGTVGRVAVVPSEAEQVVYSPQLCYFRIVDVGVLHAGYLAAWFRSHELQEQAAIRMYKSDMAPYINLQDIRSLRLPVPSIAEQRRQGEVQLTLLALHAGTHAENRRLAELRDVLLPELMSGRLRMKDAERVVEEAV